MCSTPASKILDARCFVERAQSQHLHPVAVHNLKALQRSCHGHALVRNGTVTRVARQRRQSGRNECWFILPHCPAFYAAALGPMVRNFLKSDTVHRLIRLAFGRQCPIVRVGWKNIYPSISRNLCSPLKSHRLEKPGLDGGRMFQQTC